MIFNEDKLQEEIIKTWGEFGAHNEVFTAMRKQIRESEQLRSCKYVKRIGESCTLNNNCKYPNCE